LCKGDTLGIVRDFLLGYSEISWLVSDRIDCDADPFVPDGFKLVRHQKGGSFVWDPDRIKFLYPADHLSRESDPLKNLYRKFQKEPVLNACVLEWLLSHQHEELIPEEWSKFHDILFFGTVYREYQGEECVRSLQYRFETNSWIWSYFVLDNPPRNPLFPVILRDAPSSVEARVV